MSPAKCGIAQLVLLSSVSASAQPCGWILWHQIENERGHVWKAMDGYSTIAECRTDRAVMEKRATVIQKQHEKENPNVFWVNRYSCFPSDL